MGVPKFFTFISDRYPCINKTVKEFEIPEFHNLYLDMNAIIHKCSHPADSDVHFRIGKREFSEQEIFENVTRYVELLFRIIKPKQIFFLAFDGVAPRAKMNQQRSHRFRAAKEAKRSSLINELPEEAIFDANCITPGTAFMENLNKYVKNYIAYKISTNELWRKCKVIISGPKVAGEGEHKIMEYLRYSKSQSNYDPNTSHCLYGMDADLIMLGLCSHEPHFSLLREEITFGKREQMITPEETEYRLIHLSLMRDYLEHEFSSVKNKLKFPFDLEKILDDWILMSLFVGNDFIPHLPDMHIIKGALSKIYQAYVDVLPTLDGYINESGTLRLDRLQKFTDKLSCIELEQLKVFCNEQKNVRKTSEESEDPKVIETLDCLVPIDATVSKKQESALNELEVESLQIINEEIIKHKNDYYAKKLKVIDIDEKILRTLTEEYVRAIQWSLNYYYNGCCSWSWFYPYHYAPYVSDLKDLDKLNLEFGEGAPFLPFQHLLAVLPTASKTLLPKSLQSLVTDPNSPIINYYPEDFETDLNDKTNDWEAVVLIPFIEEKILLKGTDKFPRFINHAEEKHVQPKDLKVPKEKLVKGLCPGVDLNVYFPGFPKLRFIEHTAVLKKVEETEIKQNTYLKINPPKKVIKMILCITPKQTPELKEVANELLGRTVFAGWPHLFEAYVIAVSDGNNKIILKDFWSEYSENNIEEINLQNPLRNEWKQKVTNISKEYLHCSGINIGKINIIIYAFPIIGKRYIIGKSGKTQLTKLWSKISNPYAYQTIVRKISMHVIFLLHKSVNEIFETNCKCFIKDNPYYGAMGQITKVNMKTLRVIVALKVTKEPNFDQINKCKSQGEIQYFHGLAGAKQLNISSHLLSRFMGSIFVTTSSQTRLNIGLNLKFNRQNKEVLGYTKKIDQQWMYTREALDILKNYREKFPELFDNLSKNLSANIYLEDEIIPEGSSEYLAEVLAWLQKQKTYKAPTMFCNSKSLDVSTILEIENIVDGFLLTGEKMIKNITIQVSLWQLFISIFHTGNVPPDRKAKHELYDRIICVKENFTVPLGHKGTIVGIQRREDSWNNMYDILFDTPFLGGLTLYNTTEHRCYRLATSDFINITHGVRCEQTSRADNLNRKKNEKEKA